MEGWRSRKRYWQWILLSVMVVLAIVDAFVMSIAGMIGGALSVLAVLASIIAFLSG